MTPTSFEMTVSVSQDARFAGTVREVVLCAAQYAGCADSGAARFASQVEDAVRAVLQGSPSGILLPVTVRRDAGPIEVVVDGTTLTFDPQSQDDSSL
jgi:hypothetical protein